MRRIRTARGAVALAVICAAMALALASVALLVAGETALAAVRLIYWRPVTVEIVESTIDSTYHPPRRRSRFGSRFGSWTYTPRVTYRYAAGNLTYDRSSVAPFVGGGSEEWARAVMLRYVPGIPARGYHSPWRPGASFLLADVQPFGIVTGLILADLTALLLYPAYRVIRHRRRAGALAVPAAGRPRAQRRREQLARERREKHAPDAELGDDLLVEAPASLFAGMLLADGAVLLGIWLVLPADFRLSWLAPAGGGALLLGGALLGASAWRRRARQQKEAV